MRDELKSQERENLDQMQMPVDNADSVHEVQEEADDDRFETENPLRAAEKQSNFDEDDSVEEDDDGPEEVAQGDS